MILDLNEQTIKDMQEYCDHHNITINKLITDLFVRYIKEPTATFFEEENGLFCYFIYDFCVRLSYPLL